MAKDFETANTFRNEFWTRVDDIRAGMLSADGASPRPMAHTAKREDKALWFITAKGTDIAEAASQNKSGQYVLACAHGQLYAAIDGQMSIERDADKLDEIWSPMAAIWFENGRQDDDVTLVRFTPQQGELWLTDGAGKALFEMARARLTGKTPDVGEHAELTF